MANGNHSWGRNGSWGYECYICKMQSGKKFDDLPKSGCRGR